MSSLDIRAIRPEDGRTAPPPKASMEYRVFIAEAAFDHAVARGEQDSRREIGGVLVGEVRRDDAGPYLVIEDTIDALHAEEKTTELTFTHATWEHIHKELDARFAGKKVVGWYHTHPGFGVFLSDRDQFIHRSFFNLPFQVALVYDPKSKEHGVFGWRDNEPWRLRRYWIGEREHAWDGDRGEQKQLEKIGKVDRQERDREAAADRAPARDRDEKPAERPRPAEEGEEGGPAFDWVTVGGIGLILVLLAGFAGHWLGSRSAVGIVQQAALQLTQAKAEGAIEAARDVNLTMLTLIQETLGDEATRKPLDDAMGALDGAIATLEALPAGATGPDPRVAEAVAKLKDARSRLVTARERRTSAEAMLLALANQARRAPEARADFGHELAKHRQAIGRLYAELAEDMARAGDTRRAKSLLSTAAAVDPGNARRYEQQLQKFEKGGSLPGSGPRPAQPRMAPMPFMPASPGAVIPAPAAPPSAGPR